MTIRFIGGLVFISFVLASLACLETRDEQIWRLPIVDADVRGSSYVTVTPRMGCNPNIDVSFEPPEDWIFWESPFTEGQLDLQSTVSVGYWKPEAQSEVSIQLLFPGKSLSPDSEVLSTVPRDIGSDLSLVELEDGRLAFVPPEPEYVSDYPEDRPCIYSYEAEGLTADEFTEFVLSVRIDASM